LNQLQEIENEKQKKKNLLKNLNANEDAKAEKKQVNETSEISEDEK
jgi:hypothetical protein